MLVPGGPGLPVRLQDGLTLAFRPLPAESAQRRARGAGQRDRLEHRQTVGDRVGAENLHGRGDRALRADPQPERGQQLRDVHAQHQVAGRDLPAAQIGQDDRAGAVDQDGVARQSAVRDPARLQGTHLLPGVVHQSVGDPGVVQRVQGAAAGVLVDQHHGVGTQLGGGDQLRRVGSGRDGRIGQQGLLLQRLAQRLQTAPGGDAAQRQPPPGPVEEPLGLLLPVDDRDVERRAVLQGDEVTPAAVAVLRAVREILAGRRQRMEPDRAQPRHQRPAGGTHVRGADGVQRAVGDAPADQHRQDDREGGGVARDEHRERVQEQHHPQHGPPARPAGHPDGRHIGDDGGEVAVHRVGQGVRVTGGGLGERLLDGVGGRLGDPQVGGERHPVREDGGQHAVGDTQPVAFDQPFDREGDRDQQDRDARRQAGELDQQVGGLSGALVDVLFEPRGGAVREGRDHQQDDDREEPHPQPHEVRGTVHARGEQRFVALHLVVVDLFGRFRSRAGRLGGVRLVVVLAVVRPAVVRRGGVRARRRLRGALRALGMHTLLSHRLFLVSYHLSPPARWWHARPTYGVIRVHMRERTVCPTLPSGARDGPGRPVSHCRWRRAGWDG